MYIYIAVLLPLRADVFKNLIDTLINLRYNIMTVLQLLTGIL